MSLKEKLLLLNIVEDNEYLDKYVELIESNRKTKREKFKTQKHHIIPRYYYKKNNLEVNDSDSNCVNLLYKDHCLAHYYLCLCSVDKQFRYINYHAIEFVIGNSNFKLSSSYIDETEMIRSLDRFQELYEESAKLKSEKYKGKFVGLVMPESAKQEISRKLKGRVYIHKDNIAKMIHKEELQQYLDAGWIRGSLPFSEEGKKKISEKMKGRTCIKRLGKKYINNMKQDK